MDKSIAVELDYLLPLAHASLGWTLLWNRAIEDAIAEVTKATDNEPALEPAVTDKQNGQTDNPRNIVKLRKTTTLGHGSQDIAAS